MLSNGSVVKNLPAVQERQVRYLGWGDPPGGENGNPLQYSCLKSPIDIEAWQATVHGVTKSQTRLNDWAHYPGLPEHFPACPQKTCRNSSVWLQMFWMSLSFILETLEWAIPATVTRSTDIISAALPFLLLFACLFDATAGLLWPVFCESNDFHVSQLLLRSSLEVGWHRLWKRKERPEGQTERRKEVRDVEDRRQVRREEPWKAQGGIQSALQITCPREFSLEHSLADFRREKW